jgi:hypothetical protein
MGRRRRDDLPRSVEIPILRRTLPHGRLGESKKGSRRRYITVTSKQKGLVALSTAIHESIHQMSHSLSERTVRQLERAVLYLVIDNPELFKRILRRVR